MLTSVSFAVGIASVPMIGMAIGAERIARARRIAWTAGLLSFVSVGLIGTFVAIFPDLWVDIFTHDPNVRAASQQYLSQSAPELLNTLHRHHDVFRAMLQINLTVLATAHAVSESIIRGVNTEIQRKNIPNTYTAAGRRAAPGPRNMTPLAVSRSL